MIFKHATGSGKVYNTPLNKEYFGGYDSNGNLFADGFDSGYNFMLVELPKGHKKFVTIKTSNSPEFPGIGAVGRHLLTVFDQLANKMFQYTVSGTTATLKRTIKFTGVQ